MPEIAGVHETLGAKHDPSWDRTCKITALLIWHFVTFSHATR